MPIAIACAFVATFLPSGPKSVPATVLGSASAAVVYDGGGARPQAPVAATPRAPIELVAQAGDDFRQLRGRDIVAKFSGMEFTDDVHWSYGFDPNGMLEADSMGRESKGKWRVDKDTLCLERKREGHSCYHVWMSGKHVQLRPTGLNPPLEGMLQRPQTGGH